MQMTTVFDGLLPASGNPGVDPGASVVVWTPTRDGVYNVVVSLPDEEGTPFGFNTAASVDLDSSGGIVVDPIIAAGTISDEINNGDPIEGSATLSSNLDHATRVVVKVGVVAYADGVTPGDTTIVPLDELKLGLGLDPLDTSEDLLLTMLEAQAATFVETQTGRKWSAPSDRTEFIKGLGVDTLYLGGHVAGDPAAIVSVRRRGRNSRDFDDVDVEDFILRGDTLVSTAGVWSHLYEYEVIYSDGYELGSAPADIRALVIDLVGISYGALGEEGIKSESIGDFSYTLDSAVAVAAASLSDTSAATMNRYRRMSI